MSLVQTITDQMKSAMRDQNKTRVTTLRSLRAAFLNAMKADGSESLSDEQALAALAADGRLVKRPYLITSSGRVVTGFRPEVWQVLLGV